jgi:outer membrane cobalamin receptor
MHIPARVLTTLMLGAFASAAHAQSGESNAKEPTLEQLLNVSVVTVTRAPEGAAAAPGRVEVVTATQIERRGYRSLLDVLRDLPGIKVDLAVDQDTYGSVTIQGTPGTSRVVVLLDGIRISSPTNEALPMFANFPVHNARQVEVVYGPTSALYGADAFSAVINIISKEGVDAEGLRVNTTVGQAGLSNTEATYGARLGSLARVTMSGQFLYDRQPDLTRSYPDDFGDLASHRTGVFNTIFGPMAAGTPVSPDYHVPLRAHTFYTTLTAGRVQAALFHSSIRASNTPAYTPDNALYNDTAFAQNDILVGTVAYSAGIGRLSTTSTFTASRHELDPQSGYVNVYSNMQRSYKYAYGSMVRGEQQAIWKMSPTLSLAAGGAYEHLFSIPQGADLNAPISSRDRPGTILGTDIPDELFRLRYSNVGAYGQAQWSPHRRVSLTTGGRVDYNSRYDTVFNPRVGLVSRLTRSTTTKLLYGGAYLAPSPYQAYAHYGAFYSLDGGETYQSEFWHVPNPDLKPQRKRTIEAQVQQALSANLHVTFSTFYSRFTDLVHEFDATSRLSGSYLGWPVAYLQQSVNGGRETTYGGTASIDVLERLGTSGQLYLRGAFSLVDGRVARDDAPAGRVESGGIAPVLGQVTADLDWADWSLASRMITVGKQRAFAFYTAADGRWRRRTIDGHATADLTLRRRRVARALDVFVTAENLLDARYRALNPRAFSNPEEFEGSPQNPRRLLAGVQVRLR